MSEFFDDSRPAPFPESGLDELASYFRREKAGAKTEYGRDLYEQRVQTCVDANKTHAAVRERMLIGETENKRLTDILARARALAVHTPIKTRTDVAQFLATLIEVLEGNIQPTGDAQA